MISAEKFMAETRPKAVLRATGDDVFDFLQGQFTNELRQPSDSAIYGLWLNQKGKTLADSRVLRISEREFLIVSRGTPAPVIRQRLGDYIVADDVTLVDETDTTSGFLVGGQNSSEAVGRLLGATPAPGKFAHAKNALVLRGRSLPGENFEIIGTAEAIADLKRQFRADGFVERAPAELEASRIRAGIPAVPSDLGPGDLPNEGGLDDTAISYTKGCYLGQEVMARLKNLGQVRRRLHVVEGQGAPPAPLTPLYQGEKKVGELRSVAAEADGFVAFAMLSLVNLKPDAGLSLEPAGAARIAITPHG